MSKKQRKNYNIRHKKGGKFDNVIEPKKNSPLLRPVSTDAGAWITENPLNLFAYTFAVMAILYALKLIIR